MSFLDTIKNLFSSKASEAVQGLKLDSAVTSIFEQIVSKLDELKNGGSLDDITSKALETFKPALESFKANADVTAFISKAKTFLSGLSVDSLPTEVKSLVEKVQGLLK